MDYGKAGEGETTKKKNWEKGEDRKWEKGKDEREKKGARRKRNGDRPRFFKAGAHTRSCIWREDSLDAVK